MKYSEKIKLIRKTEELTQSSFSDLTSIPLSSLKKIEAGFSEIGLSNISKITNHERFKKYTLWLMNDDVMPELGQISPYVEEMRPGKEA